MKRTFALTLAITLICICCACSSSGQLEGYWHVSGAAYAPADFPDDIEFFSDGTFAADGLSGEYTAERGRLKISAWGTTMTYDYSVSGDTLTLKADGQEVRYSNGAGHDEADFASGGETDVFVEASGGASQENEEPIPEPTLSPKEQLVLQIDQELEAIQGELAEYDDAEDVEGALEYLTEQLELLQLTYSGADFGELEQAKSDYTDAYRQQALQEAKSAYEASGHEDALDILYQATALLGGDDEEINDALDYYAAFGPKLFTDFLDTYFYRETQGGVWAVETSVVDNTGEEYESAVRLYSDSTGGRPPSFYTYLLSGDHSTFSGHVFLGQDTRSTPSSAVVKIYADDDLLWESPVFTGGVLPVDFSVDVSGYSQLKIESQVLAFIDGNHIRIYMADGVLNP